MKEVATRALSGFGRRGLADPATAQMATKLRKGLSEIRSSVGGDVDVDSASWWSFVEATGLLEEASKQGCGGTIS